MVNYFYDGNERSTVFGMQSACEGLGGVAITFHCRPIYEHQLAGAPHSYWIAFPIVFLFGCFVPAVSIKDILAKSGCPSSCARFPANDVMT